MNRFIRIPNCILDVSYTSMNTLKVLCYLCSLAEHSRVIVKADTICDRCRIKSRKTVYRSLRELEQLGLLTVLHRHGADGYLRASEYCLHIPCRGKWFKLDADTLQYPKAAFALAALMSRSANRRHRSWHSLRNMARTLGLAKGTVIQAIRQLEKLGFLLKGKLRAGKHNLYLLTKGLLLIRMDAVTPIKKECLPLIKAPQTTRSNEETHRTFIVRGMNCFVKSLAWILCTLFSFLYSSVDEVGQKIHNIFQTNLFYCKREKILLIRGRYKEKCARRTGRAILTFTRLSAAAGNPVFSFIASVQAKNLLQ